MATCYICGKSHAEYRREVKTGNSYRTGISSRGRTSYSTQSHYGPRCVCAECALNIDYKNKKISGGASFFYGLSIANTFFLLFWGFFGGTKGFGIGCGLCLLFFIIGFSFKKSKEAEADAWYEANKSHYIDNIDIKGLASVSEKFAKALEKDFNNLLHKVYKFKENANKCLLSSKSLSEFQSVYEDCNTVILHIDAFINQGTETKRDFDTNIRNQYGSKDVVTQTLDNCSSVWKSVIDQLVKEKSEIQQLQKRFIVSDNQSSNESGCREIVNNNVPLGYKTADVFDPNYWTKEFWENVTVEQINNSNSSGVNNKDSNDYDALTCAALYSSNPEVIKLLSEKGCDVNRDLFDGRSIVMYLLQQRYYKVSILRALLQSNYDINRIFNCGDTTLTFALKAFPNFEAIKTLIEFGADVNIPDSKNQHPIDVAVNKNDVSVEIVKLLINTGVKIFECEGKNSALTYAVTNPNNSEKIQLLINFGYHVDFIINDQNCTSLFAACLIHNNQENIQTLIKNGAKINHQSSYGRTCLLESIIQLYSENVAILLDKGADYNICDNDGISPLFAAAFFGDAENLNNLISRGADVNLPIKQGVTALSQCFKSDNAEKILDILLKAGADINIKDEEDNTVLMFALNYDKDIGIIRTLIKMGQNINHINKKGETPLSVALEKESHPDVIKLLLDNGADKNLKDKNGNTMMQLALKNPNSEIVKIFME